MAAKIKIAFSLDPDLVAALKQQAPGGNASAFVESCLRKSLVSDRQRICNIDLIHQYFNTLIQNGKKNKLQSEIIFRDFKQLHFKDNNFDPNNNEHILALIRYIKHIEYNRAYLDIKAEQEKSKYI